jgi:mono/diheme cytochrome c family protein
VSLENRARRRPATALGAVVVAAVSWTAGAQMKVPVPTPGLEVDMVAGKQLYERHCASCHGADLRGTKEGPSLVHPIYRPSHHSDIAFQLAVKHGSRQHHWNFGDMKPVPGLTADDVAHITAYIRHAQREAEPRR